MDHEEVAAARTGTFAAIPHEATSAEAEEVLRQADWAGFDAERDLVRLRDSLCALETREGVTGAHRLATEKLRERGALLRHPDVHRADLTSHALSPDGRYLAVGSWISENQDLGTLQIWEVSTGRCVNVLDKISGGIGWPGYFRCVQWSADSRMITSEFSSNVVGKWASFGTRVDPPLADVTHASVAGTGGRPAGYALAPDASSIYIHRYEEDPGFGVNGGLAPLTRSYFSAGIEEPEALPLNEPDADLDASLNGHVMDLMHSQFSADGSRIWGFGEWVLWGDDEDDGDRERESGAVAIDVESRTLVWYVDVVFNGYEDYDRMAVSRDETLVVLHLDPDKFNLYPEEDGSLAFLDAVTGQQRAEAVSPFKMLRLRWGQRGNVPRLALVDVQHEHDCGVRVYDGTAQRYDVPVRPKPPNHDQADCFSWDWAPDGIRAACLTSDDQIEIWSLDEEPQRIACFPAPSDAVGVWWGAGDVVVVSGPKSLRFHDLTSNTMLSDFRFNRKIRAARPLSGDKGDRGMLLDPQPTFALDDTHWAVAFPEGVVLADHGTGGLDDLLAFSVDYRYAWPFRWGEVPVVPDVAAACPHLAPGTQEVLKPLLRSTTGGG